MPCDTVKDSRNSPAKLAAALPSSSKPLATAGRVPRTTSWAVSEASGYPMGNFVSSETFLLCSALARVPS